MCLLRGPTLPRQRFKWVWHNSWGPSLAVFCVVLNRSLVLSSNSQVRRSTRRQLHILRKKSGLGAHALAHSSSSNPDGTQQRRPGDRLGGIPSSSTSTTPNHKQQQRQHLSPTAAASAAANGSTGRVATTAPKDALASELWAWLGGVGSGRSCSADRPKRSSERSGGGSEWRGAFYNREYLCVVDDLCWEYWYFVRNT